MNAQQRALLQALETFDRAAQTHGWEADQGSEENAKKAARLHKAAKARLRNLLLSMSEDAAKWRALRSSARIRALGSAGIDKPNPDGYAHLGLELWTRHPAPSDPIALEWLDRYVEIIREHQE